MTLTFAMPKSASTKSVLLPYFANKTERLVAISVFPTPPLPPDIAKETTINVFQY